MGVGVSASYGKPIHSINTRNVIPLFYWHHEIFHVHVGAKRNNNNTARYHISYNYAPIRRSHSLQNITTSPTIIPRWIWNCGLRQAVFTIFLFGILSAAHLLLMWPLRERLRQRFPPFSCLSWRRMVLYASGEDECGGAGSLGWRGCLLAAFSGALNGVFGRGTGRHSGKAFLKRTGEHPTFLFVLYAQKNIASLKTYDKNNNHNINVPGCSCPALFVSWLRPTKLRWSFPVLYPPFSKRTRVIHPYRKYHHCFIRLTI